MASNPKAKKQLLVLAMLLLVFAGFSLRGYFEYRDFNRAKAIFDDANRSLEAGHWLEAEAKLEKTVEEYKYMPAAWEELATVKELLGKYEESADVLARSVEHLPKSVRLRVLYSIALIKLDRKEEAMEQARLVHTMDPAEPQAAMILRSPDKIAAYFQEKREKLNGRPEVQLDHHRH